MSDREKKHHRSESSSSSSSSSSDEEDNNNKKSDESSDSDSSSTSHSSGKRDRGSWRTAERKVVSPVRPTKGYGGSESGEITSSDEDDNKGRSLRSTVVVQHPSGKAEESERDQPGRRHFSGDKEHTDDGDNNDRRRGKDRESESQGELMDDSLEEERQKDDNRDLRNNDNHSEKVKARPARLSSVEKDRPSSPDRKQQQQSKKPEREKTKDDHDSNDERVDKGSRPDEGNEDEVSRSKRPRHERRSDGNDQRSHSRERNKRRDSDNKDDDDRERFSARGRESWEAENRQDYRRSGGGRDHHQDYGWDRDHRGERDWDGDRHSGGRGDYHRRGRGNDRERESGGDRQRDSRRDQQSTDRADDRNRQRQERKRPADDSKQDKPTENSGSGDTTQQPPAKKAKDGEDTLTTRTGGAYIPPARLRMMQAQITDKSSVAYQRIAWEALKKSINGLINKVNTSNIINIVKELFQENIVRGRGLLTRSIIQAQMASPTFTHVYSALVAIINTKFPQNGELVLRRLIIQFRKGFRRNDKNLCLSSTRFIAHLVNQQVAHEVLALEVLTLLLEAPTNDSVEISIGFLKECGQKLTEVSPRGINAIFDRLRHTLHEGEIDNRVQYMVEVMFAVRKDGFKDHQAVISDLDLVEEDDQFTHLITLEEAGQPEDLLNVFRPDPEFLDNEEKYKTLKKEILDEDSSDGESGEDGSGEESSGEEDGEEDEEEKQKIIDNTETNLVALRRTIYLTVQSSLEFEECTHKILRMDLKPGQEIEVCNMVLDCCAQQRTYEKFFGLLAQRFCQVDKKFIEPFQNIFKEQYETIHRLETNKLRNVAKFFGHLLHTDSISWGVLSCVMLNEEDTSSASRIFVKIFFQELSEYMGLPKLNDRLKDPTLQSWFEGIMPRDNPKNTRFAINFFTTIGLGGLTDDLRDHLKNMSKQLMQQKQMVEPEQDSSSSTSSASDSGSDADSSDSANSGSDSSSDSSSEDSSSEDDDKKKKKRSKGKKGTSPKKNKADKKQSKKPDKDKRKPVANGLVRDSDIFRKEKENVESYSDPWDRKRNKSTPKQRERDNFLPRSREKVKIGDKERTFDRERSNRAGDRNDRQKNVGRGKEERATEREEQNGNRVREQKKKLRDEMPEERVRERDDRDMREDRNSGRDRIREDKVSERDMVREDRNKIREDRDSGREKAREDRDGERDRREDKSKIREDRDNERDGKKIREDRESRKNKIQEDKDNIREHRPRIREDKDSEGDRMRYDKGVDRSRDSDGYKDKNSRDRRDREKSDRDHGNSDSGERTRRVNRDVETHKDSRQSSKHRR